MKNILRTTQRKIYFSALIVIVSYTIYASFASKNYQEIKWIELTFKAKVYKQIKTPRLIYYQFIKNDSIFELKDHFSNDFMENVQIGDSVYKIKGINYCIIFSKNGKQTTSKF